MNLLALLADILLIGPSLFTPDMTQWLESATAMSGRNSQVEQAAPPQDDAALKRLLGGGRFDRAVVAASLLHAPVAQLGAMVQGDPHMQLYVVEPWPLPQQGDFAGWRAELRRQSEGLQERLAAWNGLRPEAAPPIVAVPLAWALAQLSQAIEDGAVPGLATTGDILNRDGTLNARGRFFAAMVIHGVVNGADPTGMPVWRVQDAQRVGRDEALDVQTVVVLQRLAWRSLQEPRPRPVVAPAADQAAQAQNAQQGSELGGVTRPGIGFNLTGISDWSTEMPFLDVFKTARPWIGHIAGRWGGYEAEELRDAGFLDAHGWPTGLPNGADAVSTLLLTDLPPEATTAAGRYVLRYDGRGRIRLDGRATRVEQQPGVIRFDFTPGEGAVEIRLSRIDPVDPIRNITLIREDREDLARQGQFFNPDFLARLRGAEELRFMPWMNANTTTLSRPQDRPRLTDAIWGGPHGVPFEVMVDLANQVGADAWFTIPHLASDDLVREYARLAHEGLDDGRRALVEFSNEVWNPGFPQARWAEEQARAEWGTGEAGVQYGAYRAAQVADIWAEVFGPDADSRLVRVIGTQTGWQGREEDILNAPAWQKADPNGWRAPYESFDAYAIAGYFGPPMNDPARVQMYKGWIEDSLKAATEDAAKQGLAGSDAARHIREHRFDLAFPVAISELADGSVSGDPQASVRQVVEESFPYHAAIAAKYDLELVMYEGGTHVVGLGDSMEDDDLTAFLTALNYAPGIGALYDDLITGWQQVSDNPFNDFNAIEYPSRYGSWGTLRWPGDDNPRWRAVAQGTR